MRKQLSVAAAALLVAPWSIEARAGTVALTNQAQFQANVSSGVVGGFAGVPTPNPDPYLGGGSYGGYNPLSGYAALQGVSFNTPNLGGVVNVNTGGYYGANDFTVPYAVNSVYQPGSGPDVVSIVLPAPVTAFALGFNTLFASTTATFTLSNGFTTSVANTATIGSYDFLGFLSTTPFQTVTLSVPSQQSWVIPGYGYGVATGVPEPATWALMLTGFGGLGFCARRRRAAGQGAAISG